MRKHKGSWIVNVKDTYHLGEINSAVLAHIQKLYDTIKDRECIGIPMYYVDKQAELQGVDHDHRPDDVDLDAAHQLRLRDLEELIWTYTNNEPKITDYDFHMNWIHGEKVKGSIGIPVEITCTNDEELDRYTKDIDKYWERITAGYELAGKIWRELQW
jgi:hypothetical protein